MVVNPAERPPSAATPSRRTRQKLWLLVAALSGVITLTNQVWVGRATIYANDLEQRRELVHEAVLSNHVPQGSASWNSIGANGFNIRVLTVWTAEGMRAVTGQSLAKSYFIIETCALFACCLLLFVVLELCAGSVYALTGVLYFGSILPLTYVLYFFHPWDKPSLVAWLAAMWCTLRCRWRTLAIVLAIGVTIKYDIVVFPGVVFLSEVRRAGWRAAARLTAPLAVVTLGMYIALRWCFPGGFEARDWASLAGNNLRDLWAFGPRHPPLLALGLPAFLAVFGYSSASDFGKAAVQFSLVVAAILFVQTNFREFRAETPVLALLMPAAAAGVDRLLSGALREHVMIVGRT